MEELCFEADIRYSHYLASSPLRPALEPGSATCDPDTVVFAQEDTERDLLKVGLCIKDTDDAVAAADFAVIFDPKILDYVGFEPGSFFAGRQKIYGVDDLTPGRVEVAINRLPNVNTIVSGPELLVSLFLRARSEGQTTVDFAPRRREQPTLLDASNVEVAGISFVGGAEVVVGASGSEPAQRIAFSSTQLDFGQVSVDTSSRRRLRISNFGFSDLQVLSVDSSLPEITSFFTSTFSLPPFGFVNLTVEFSPTQAGPVAGDLLILSDDPETGMGRVSLAGEGIGP